MNGRNSSCFLSSLVLHSKQNLVPNVLEELSYPAWDLDKHRANISHMVSVANGIIGNTQFKIFKLYYFLFFIFYLQVILYSF